MLIPYTKEEEALCILPHTYCRVKGQMHLRARIKISGQYNKKKRLKYTGAHEQHRNRQAAKTGRD